MTDINDTANQTYDAQMLAEEIAEGKQETPKVNVEADYEASKQYSQSEIDQTPAGTQAAEKATAPKFDIPEASEQKQEPQPTGDPADFREMAKEVNPQLKA
jgi:hypothetical protein